VYNVVTKLRKEANKMSRFEIIEKLVEARVAQCKKQNFEKFGNNDFARVNENPDTWRKFYKTYPMRSKKFPMFSLVGEYNRYYG
jgi:hypothetical protein